MSVMMLRSWSPLLFAMLGVFACADQPRTEGYRKVEFFSLGDSQGQFVCQIGVHGQWTTYERTTPWMLQMDLDTIPECFCGTHCRFWKASAGPDSLRMRAFDRDGLQAETCSAVPAETLNVGLRDYVWDAPDES